MPTCNVDVAITKSNGTYSASFSDGGGVGSVAADGTITLTGQAGAVNLAFSITTPSYAFRDSGFSASAIQQFGTATVNGSACSVNDQNSGAKWEYVLYCVDNTVSPGVNFQIDPKVINR